MVKLTDEMEAMRKKARKKGDDPARKLSASALPDKSMAVEKRVAEMEKLCDRYQTENSVSLLHVHALYNLGTNRLRIHVDAPCIL